ncbi:hypothetical protein C8F04DRAFT_1197740 [Mycena alexandri]|uniref:Uncharacterized protein n=1 Tax=Mycena alexandri TaxID=1745969 RepID=A0AAD6S341_9AGAR|nr:hypothetical protein C8F04DRAFT_1197740 [Mycena alexandri]
MSKKRKPRSKAPNPSGAFKPGPTRAEKCESQKKAAKAYYRRNAEEIREKNRLSIQERRAAAKAKKRQWDPPKKGKTTEQALLDESHRRSPSFDVNLVSDELLNRPLHFKDCRGAPSSDEDSDFRRMDLRRRIRTESSEVNTAPQSVHTTSEERVAIEVLTTMGGRVDSSSDGSILRRANLLSFDEASGVDQAPPAKGSIVDKALSLVAKLNELPLTPPTEREARRWDTPPKSSKEHSKTAHESIEGGRAGTTGAAARLIASGGGCSSSHVAAPRTQNPNTGCVSLPSIALAPVPVPPIVGRRNRTPPISCTPAAVGCRDGTPVGRHAGTPTGLVGEPSPSHNRPSVAALRMRPLLLREPRKSQHNTVARLHGGQRFGGQHAQPEKRRGPRPRPNNQSSAQALLDGLNEELKRTSIDIGAGGLDGVRAKKVADPGNSVDRG